MLIHIRYGGPKCRELLGRGQLKPMVGLKRKGEKKGDVVYNRGRITSLRVLTGDYG